jgi:hypothetical protein
MSMKPAIAWGPETNGLRAGICIVSGQFGNVAPDIIIDIGNYFTTNNYTTYLLPPTGNSFRNYLPPEKLPPGVTVGKLPFYIEMRTSDGRVLIPKDKSIDDKNRFPKIIPREKLPVRSWSHTFVGSMNISTNSTTPFFTANLGDIFNLETNTGSLILSVWVKMYEFEPDYKSVKLIELPPVSATIQLPFNNNP